MSILYLILSAILNSVMDVLFTRFDSSIFKNFGNWWNPKKSWKNKWSYPIEDAENKWYYFGFLPDLKERFPYSSTSFVFLTDAWHFAKFLMLGCIVLSIVTYEPIYSPLIDMVIYYALFTITFTLFYSKILVD